MQRNGSLKCARCQETKPETAFAVDGSRSRGRRYRCRECEARAFSERYKARPEHHRRLVRESRRRNLAKALIRGAKKRAIKRGLPFDLDGNLPEIEARLRTGVCELTGLPFDLKGSRGGWANPSIDRINNRKGYVYGNVRLILHGLNTAIGSWGEDVLLRMIAAWQARK